jgi:enolase-phosphatase E1
MNYSEIQLILTDIEGTTTSIDFVYDILFPYFRSHIGELRGLIDHPEIQKAFKQTVDSAMSLENKKLNSIDEIINTLYRWSEEDRKLTPLKTVQGIIWKNGYESGAIKGHVYDEVLESFQNWTAEGKQIGIFSSGSVPAQKLLFANSTFGDLTTYISCYFDTQTGGKREVETYEKIARKVDIRPENILFLSDIKEELEAADKAGINTLQLIRENKIQDWKDAVRDFSQIQFN